MCGWWQSGWRCYASWRPSSAVGADAEERGVLGIEREAQVAFQLADHRRECLDRDVEDAMTAGALDVGMG